MLQFKFILSFLLLYLKYANTAFTRVDLNGIWYIKNADNGFADDLEATVPGGIYSDLMNNKVINDVFYGYNDVETRWVSKRNWTYTKDFYINNEIYNHNVINLVFDGLDTFAEIYVNDKFIGETENMFVQYIYNIKEHLETGNNSIMIKFQSPVEKAKYLYDKQKEYYEVPPSCVPDAYNGECHVNHIRKMQASFSWDWGPALPSVGIWKNVYLEAYDVSILRDVTVNIQEDILEDLWEIAVTAYFTPSETILEGNLFVQLHTDIGLIRKGYYVNVTQDENEEFLTTCSFSIEKSAVKLWWPNGYGNPSLYKMTIKFVTREQEDVSSKDIKVGFRTIELVQNSIAGGTSFFFLVNNVPIFAKGTNSIPLNILPEKGQDRKLVRYLLKSAKDVHMNMIRVWGGGIYESDAFYETADALGIMIWQDFMFACSMYPVNDEFLKTVKSEVRHQVRRLQYHPSIVLWAGNNENEAALRQNWYGTWKNFKQYHADYVKLYVDTIEEEVLVSDISRPFLTSSPTNGLKSIEEDYVALNPQSEFYGDVHHYDYITNPWNQELFPLPRFSSEYGYQSLPSMATLRTATHNESDLSYNSDFMKHRQHHPAGNEEMKLLIDYQLKLPSKTSEKFFEAYVYYGQIIQAMAIKLQTEFYRIWRSNFLITGKGMTMGALYWQLNDVWVAPTWSGIDFNNNWKMQHYYAKDFFAPVIITSYTHTNRNVDFYIVSDLMRNSYNNTATISVYKWNSFDVIKQDNISVDILSGYSKQIHSFWMDIYLRDAGCGTLFTANQNCFIRLSLTNNRNEAIAPDNYIYPSKIKKANLSNSVVEITSVTQIDTAGKVFEVNVQASAISLFVWLEVDNIRGTFSDNGFLQFTNIKTVRFVAESATTADLLKSAITVTHYLDARYSH